MKTTLELPEDVLSEAICCSEGQTKQEIIILALKEFSRKRKLEAMLGHLGRSDTFMNPEELLALRTQDIVKQF